MFTPDEWQSIRLSLQVSATATLAAAPFAVFLAWLLARQSFWGKALLENLTYLPLVLPPVVTGYLLLVMFGRRGWIGQWLNEWLGIRLTFRWEGAALAAAVMAFPLMVRATRSAFEQIDIRLEQAARSLGAGSLDLFFTISLPLARRGVVAGTLLGFARALGEFGATIAFAGNIAGETRTVPLAVFNQLNQPEGFDRSWRLVLASIAIAATALWVSGRLEKSGKAK